MNWNQERFIRKLKPLSILLISIIKKKSSLKKDLNELSERKDDKLVAAL